MRTTVLCVFLIAALTAGCETSAPQGRVTRAGMERDLGAGPQIGEKAPQLKFIGADGGQRTLRPADGWISLIGFVDSRGGECCMLSPALTQTAGRYWDAPVRTIQVSQPTAACPHGPGCVEACHVEALHLMALCDTSQAAYDAFGSPADGTVVVVGSEGRIVAVTTVDKIESVYSKVDALAKEAKRMALPTYQKIYTGMTVPTG